MNISSDYFVQKFYQLVAYTKYNRLQQTYNGCCPICREGKSFKAKRRLFYILKKNLIFCHNCGFSGTPVTFIIRVTNQTFKEILEESKEYDILPTEVTLEEASATLAAKIIPTLPQDCINLFDEKQVNYFKSNSIVQQVLEYVKKRRLDTAINKPISLWLSLTDFIHKNRLILPFYDGKEIAFYQSREIFPNEAREWECPKYLGKVNGEKTLFNLDRVDPTLDKLFVFEGPINACFTPNGIAVAGIQDNSELTLTMKQQQQLSAYFTYELIWCLDSQWIDAASNKKTQILIEGGHKVFIWPETYGKIFKDFNDIATRLQKDGIPASFITKNAHSGMSARLLMSQIKI